MSNGTRYDDKTALLVVDVQNDFADPKGSLYVKGGEETIPLINDEIARASAAGAPICYTQDWHPSSTPHFEKDGGVWPVHCVMNTWGAEFHPNLVVSGDVVRKGSNGEDGYSGFTQRDPVSGREEPTALERLLRSSGAERIVVVGLATDYCVRASALDGVKLGFDVTVLPAATRAVDLSPGDGDAALREIEAAGGHLS